MFSNSSYIVGGIGLGEAVTRTFGDNATSVFGALHQPATTLDADAMLGVPYLRMTGQVGGSFTRRAYGLFGRLVTLFDGERSQQRSPWWQGGVDVTGIRSTLSPATVSAGVIARFGRIGWLQGGVRVGERWRHRDRTPVLTVDGVRSVTFHLGSALLVSSASSKVTFTHIPASRDASDTVFTGTKKPIVLGDATLRVQAVRGAWVLGTSATVRVGTSVNVWDNPVTAAHYQPSNDGHYAAIARAAWRPVPQFTIAAEGGRQLGDPEIGLAGVRYVSLAVRFNFATSRMVIGGIDVAAYRGRTNGADVVPRDGQVVIGSPTADGYRRLILQTHDARPVEIAADFTQWQPTALGACPVVSRVHARATNAAPDAVRSWCGRFLLPSGVYHVIYRSGGGVWRVPNGVPAVNDTFGGKVGLLIIP